MRAQRSAALAFEDGSSYLPAAAPRGFLNDCLVMGVVQNISSSILSLSFTHTHSHTHTHTHTHTGFPCVILEPATLSQSHNPLCDGLDTSASALPTGWGPASEP